MPRRLSSADRVRPVSSRFDELTIGASSDEVRRASDWLYATCRRNGVPEKLVERLVLCLNEVLANVIVHGGSAALSSPVKLVLEIRLDEGCGKAGVTVSDAGLAFDPASVTARTLPKTLEEASLGGLGLVMIRRLSDWLDYRNEHGRNHLTFGARWSLQ
jgi:anti-sigma regulatory factor (Ser/Thr protein kinase)